MLSRSTFIRRLVSTSKRPTEAEDPLAVDGIEFDDDTLHHHQGQTHNNYYLRPGTPLPSELSLRPRSGSNTSQYSETEAAGQPQTTRSQTSSPSQKSRLWVPRSKTSATSKNTQLPGSIFLPRPHIVQRGSPLADGTPHSSTSSLCSCECHTDEPVTPPPPSKSPRLCLFPPDEQRPRSSSASRPNVARTRSPSPCPSTKELNGQAQTSTLNLLEALSLEPRKASNEISAPKKSSPQKATGEQPGAGWSENAQQFMYEVDEVFKPVGSTLVETKPMNQPSREQFPSQRHRTPPPVPKTIPTFPTSHSSSPPIPIPQHVRPANTYPRLPNSIKHNLSSRSRSKRNTGKRSKPPSPQNSTKRKPIHPLPSSKHNLGRYTLTENVAELLNAAGSKLFNRIEAKELLTPQQIQDLKRTRQQAEANAKEASETFDNTTSTPPPKSSQSANSSTKNSSSTTANTQESDPTGTPSTASSSTNSSSDTGGDSIVTTTLSVESEDENETLEDSFHLSDLPSRISASEVIFLGPTSPTEPFSLSFKGFGIEEDGDIVRKDFSSSREKKRPHPLSLHQEVECNDDELDTPKADTKRIVEECMIFESHKFPSPPLKSPGRSPRVKLPALPTILEVSINSGDGMASTTTLNRITEEKAVPYMAHVVENETYLFLQSTPYTLTQPAFRHGTIRFNKAELKRTLQLRALSNRSSMQEAEPRFAEETLDWTAFQNALMGWGNNAGSSIEDEEDRAEREDREQIEDDIGNWWSGLGMGQAGAALDGAGRLVAEEDTSLDMEEDYPVGSGFGTPVTAECSPVSLGETPDLPQQEDTSTIAVGRMPEMQERVDNQRPPFIQMQETLAMFENTLVFDPETCFAGPGNGLKRWSGEGQPKRYSPPGGDRYRAPSISSTNTHTGQLRRDEQNSTIVTTTLVRPRQMSADTLPPSPMAPIMVTQRDDGTAEVGGVLMGHNLGHDLDDYLKWQNEYAYAGAYYGPDS